MSRTSPPDSKATIASIFAGPENVTRYGDVSEFGYRIVALAPWVSPECTQSFLAAARELETAAVIFFEPKSNDTGLPPSPNADRWDLNDQGRWRLDNGYPVYAVPGPAGVTLINELSWFPSPSSFPDSPSHQNSTSPLSTDVSSSLNSRLFIMADTGSSFPDQGLSFNKTLGIMISLFFLLAIFVTLLVIWFAKGRPRSLNAFWRQLVGPTVPLPTTPHATPRPRATPQNEVDIEHLALNQVKVPRHVVEAMPTFIYRQDQTMAPSISRVTGITMPKAALIKPGHHGNVSLSNAGSKWSREGGHIEDQDQCSICLEHFVPGETTVRQLPCRHIFNPGCIDQYLMHRSSLCPLCRQRVH
ncbi:uncharacterized protein N7483_010120 [Penicillium malachiteum]|uniref:uncharacterized protein n=1 Tax=Penicillium malachiteum TaxID=1324776 RepID=UPI002547FC8D|nr:uncharacterized protein N7483_010120 [Penicillium malachiteum]KAJ5712939.1 hypothetical protein N7483_010120 [Penicillium malachiteum]